jgi:hypothetical protein
MLEGTHEELAVLFHISGAALTAPQSSDHQPKPLTVGQADSAYQALYLVAIRRIRRPRG